MSFYESVFILRQDLTIDNAKSLCKKFSKVLEDDEGKVAKTEYWGLRNLTYKINKNKKGHYFLINSKSSGPAILKMEKLLNIDENIVDGLKISGSGGNSVDRIELRYDTDCLVTSDDENLLNSALKRNSSLSKRFSYCWEANPKAAM